MRAILSGAYMALAVVGVVALAEPPDQAMTTAGRPLTSAMAWLVLVGGMTGLVALGGGRWRVEAGADWLMIGGLIAYAVSILAAYPVADVGERAIRVGLAVVSCLLLGLRVAHIGGSELDPGMPAREGAPPWPRP